MSADDTTELPAFLSRKLTEAQRDQAWRKIAPPFIELAKASKRKQRKRRLAEGDNDQPWKRSFDL